MTTEAHNPPVPRNSPQRDSAIEASQTERERMLRAMRVLEKALAMAAPSRESAWHATVVTALAALEDAMIRQTAELNGDEGLLADILRGQPRLENHIDQLRRQHDDLVRQIGSLREQFTSHDGETLPDVADIRRRLAWLLDALRHFQSRETDLIYEAIQVDIGEVD